MMNGCGGYVCAGYAQAFNTEGYTGYFLNMPGENLKLAGHQI